MATQGTGLEEGEAALEQITPTMLQGRGPDKPKGEFDRLMAQPVRFNPLTGTLDEKIRAYDQMAANLAALAVNGWDSVQKVKAGCWLADGAGIHPAIFMQNHYVMIVKGRLTIEPKWEFVVGVLRARLKGFRWKIEREDKEGATVWMTNGIDEFRVSYSMEDARRQNLLSRGENAWTTGNTREMCLKQAIKRCGKRTGPEALMDLPLPDFDDMPDEPEPVARVAAAAEAAIDKAFDGSPAAAPPEKEERPPLHRLGDRLRTFYGGGKKMKPAEILEKATVAYNQMQKERTGVDPKVVFKAAAEIGPVEADQIIAYLDEYDQRKVAQGRGPQAGTTEEKGRSDSTEATQRQTDVTPVGPDNHEPEPGGDLDEPPAPDVAAAVEDGDGQYDWARFMSVVKRARGLFSGRPFVKEAPSGSKVYWFTDQEVFAPLGFSASVKLQKMNEVVCPAHDLNRLGAALEEYCNAAERSR